MGFSDDLDDYLSATRQRLIHRPSSHSENTINNIDANSTTTTAALDDYERYLYNAERDIWFDTVTDTYSKYDAQRQCYIPVSFDSNCFHQSQQIHTDQSLLDDGSASNIDDEPESDASCRLVVIESTVIPVGQVILMDANGLTIGRDKKDWDTRRIRLRDMQVSKYHCQLFYDHDKHNFAITDVGSQNGTLLNGERLSRAKTSSRPFELKNGDELTLGATVLQVHQHDHGWPCKECQTSATNTTIATTAAAKTTTATTSSRNDGDEGRQKRLGNKPTTTRKQWQNQVLQKYDDEATDDPMHVTYPQQQHYVDRAQLRRERDPVAMEGNDHYQQRITSINEPTAINLQTPVQGKGYDMLQKMGWQSGQGMGMHQQGIIEPLAPKSSPYERAGLGAPILSKKDRQYQQMKQRYGHS